MLIANPNYDAVFKYLMSDSELARDIISVIVNKLLGSLTPLKQVEQTPEVSDCCLCFSAKIPQPNSELRSAVVTVHKIKIPSNFSIYSAPTNFMKVDESQELYNIYFLDFCLDPLLPKNFSFKNQTNLTCVKNAECHNFIIQIPKISGKLESHLERLLSIFSHQLPVNGDRHVVDYNLPVTDNLQKEILTKMHRLVISNKLEKVMSREDGPTSLKTEQLLHQQLFEESEEAILIQLSEYMSKRIINHEL